MAALTRGSVNELLITARFEELRSSVSRTAKQLADERGVRMTVVTGMAAFELDLAGDGIAAILRRSRPPRRGEALETPR